MDINARQIVYLDFNYLDQSEVYQYNVDQLSRVKACAPLMAKLGNEVAAWELSTQAFDTAYRKVTTTGQTKTVKTIDDERDTLYSGLIGSVNSATKSPIAAQAAAATELQEPVKRYDVKTGGEYQQETMRIGQFCEDLLANYTSQLTALGLTAWVEALQAKNTEFHEAMIARTNAEAGYVKGELTQLKQQMIAAFNVFRKLANVILIYEGDTAYATTIDQLNAEVRHYKQIIARKGGPSSGSGSGSGEGGQQTSDNGQQSGGQQSGGGEGGGSQSGGDSGGQQGGGTTPDPGTGGGGETPVNPDPGTGGGGGGADPNDPNNSED